MRSPVQLRLVHLLSSQVPGVYVPVVLMAKAEAPVVGRVRRQLHHLVRIGWVEQRGAGFRLTAAGWGMVGRVNRRLGL